MKGNGTSEMIALQECKTQAKWPSVCILLENNPAPLDRRVWQEASALTAAGYQVSIISPKGLGLKSNYETIDGIDIYRHRRYEAQRASGYFVEYAWALACEFLLALKVYWRTRFQIIHACNPPDNIFLIGAFFKLFGVRFIFDHHDLCPELLQDKFGKSGLLYRLVCLCERLTFRTADVSIATNESYREIAVSRGRMSRERVFIVRSCLDLDKVHRRTPKPELKNGRKYLVVYLGVMGPQDGVHLLLDSIELIVHGDQRQDTQFVLIGYGPEEPQLKALATQKGLDEFVTFTGAKFGEDLEDYLSTADVAVAPDPARGLNDKSTMNKILHYMAYGLPIVQYDLTEGRRSAEDAALYARNDDPKEFAVQINCLLNSESLRTRIGGRGRQRIEERLNWGVEKQELLRAYRAALEPDGTGRVTHATVDSPAPDLSAADKGLTFHNPSSRSTKYIIITPARDEETYIEKTILSVVQQTVRPIQWIIVDDGSRDSTGAIVDRYAEAHPWITALHRSNRGFRQAGGGVIDTFYDGYAQIKSSDWEYVVKLDADLSFAPDYFERCFEEFEKDPSLGIGGGCICHESNGVLKVEETPSFHVRGATKIYERKCWDRLGGLLRAPGWDTIDEVKANMLGWSTRTFLHLQVSHYRFTGGADGTWKNCIKNGRANYITGYHPVFMLFKCVRRLVVRPYLIGSLGMCYGFVHAYMNRVPRVQDRALINYTRSQQMRRLLLLDSIWK